MTADDVLFVAGTAAVLVGLWPLEPALTLIAGGVLIGSVGVLWHLNGPRRRRG